MADSGRGLGFTESDLPKPLLTAPADGLNYYLTPSFQTIDECSVYRLYPEEKYLLDKYCRGRGTILDLACGLGRTTLCIHEMGFPVVGMDFSAALIQMAHRRFPYLDLQVGSLTATGEADSTFPCVFISSKAIDMLYPLDRRMESLRECARIIESGGILIYSSTNLKCLHLFSPRYWRRPLWKLRRTFNAFKRIAPISDEGIQGIFAAPEAVIAQSEQAGFQFLEMRGPKMSSSPWFNRYFSMYIYYVFRKV